MNPIAIFLGLILLAVSVFFAASPFRSSAVTKKSPGRGYQQSNSIKPSLDKQRQAVLLALRDLDFDYQVGKVAEEDYQALRVTLLNEAAALMQSQEREKEDSIEALIQSRRKGKTKMKTDGTAGKLCQHCHAPLLPGAKFCSKCGRPVEESACPKCKQALHPDDRFCPACGTAIPNQKQSNPSLTGTGSVALPEGD